MFPMVEESTYEELKQRVRELEQSESKRKQLEKELQLTQFSVDNSMDAVYWMGPDARFIYVNNAAVNALGYSKEELLTMTVHDIGPGFPVDIWHAHWAALQETKSLVIQSIHQRKDGSTFPVEISANLIQFDSREINCAIARDITERKQVEEALQESEKRYRLIADNVADVIWTMDMNFRNTYVSPSVLQQRGYTPGEVRNQPLDKRMTSDSIVKVIALFSEKLKFIEAVDPKGWEPIEFEVEQPCKDGSIIWTTNTVRLVPGPDKQPASIVGTTHDITKRKRAEDALRKSEEKLTQALQGNSTPTFIIDGNHIITHWNMACEKLTGHSAAGMVGTNKHWVAFYPTERPVLADFIVDGSTQDEMDEYYMGEQNESVLVEGAYEGEAFFPNLEEKGKWLFFTAAPLRDHGGNVIGAIETFQDTTERKSIEDQFRQAQKMEAIGTLAGGIAHDFNNILTTIIGNASLALVDVGKDGRLREEIEEIQTAGERAATLTRQLLAFSRKQIIQPKIVNLNELLIDIEKMLGRLIGEDVDILTIAGSELWQIEADPGQMEQVLVNLVVNARDAMPMGGKITIELANKDLDESYFRNRGINEVQPNLYVMLAVSDTGSGMDNETQERLFEPFFTTKEQGKGTGLGLSTVYGIIKQNNGFIWVYSEIGKGTTFKVYLPKVKGDTKKEENERTSVSELGGSETVLIVEDDDSLRRLAQRALQQKGYHVLDAENGEDALRICVAHEGAIDLMVTDVVMPKIGGKKTAERLQPLYPNMKLIYMSGYTDDAIVHHGVLAPGLNFIEKPFSPEGLARKVREVLDDK
jgi:two-component system, cell cycle sensor histidine kinase and response regulator CckA